MKEMKKMDLRLEKIGRKLKELRLEKGYVSAEFFAWEHKIPRVQYWRMEKGTNFTMSSLLKILDAHNMTLDEFFRDL
ncbi:MAG: helix-turn-helix domain-containing protein [Flavobacteriales bacterium]